MMIVINPGARALIIMVNLRFQRSTKTPANGLRMILGMVEKKIILVKVVASPVCWYNQIPMANENNPVQIKDTT